MGTEKEWGRILPMGGIAVCLLALTVAFLYLSHNTAPTESSNQRSFQASPPQPPRPVSQNASSTKYLAFQLFTNTGESRELGQSYPAMQKNIEKTVGDIVHAIGTTGNHERRLAFIVGPIAFDDTDDDVRNLMRDSFAVAAKQDIAVGFHIDDSMFWGRLSNLNKTEDIEWTDWNKSLNTGRRLDWSSTPTKIMPQLCFNSSDVKSEVQKRAALIGEEVRRGLAMLKTEGKENLFAGVIAGWETQMGRDFDSGKYLGFCSLTNKGYSAANPPSDLDEARTEIVKEFIDFWTSSLAQAGVPDEKLYSHVAFMSRSDFDSQHLANSYAQTVNFALPSSAFGAHRYPGFSTYPESGHAAEIEAELRNNGNPAWISAEGTALDPASAEQGGDSVSMESYLASLFNHEAVLVNVFGWGVGPTSNPFRRVAEAAASIEAYKKFLGGAMLSESAIVSGPGGMSLPDKIHKIQNEAPTWIQAHPDSQQHMQSLFTQLDGYIKAKDFVNAQKVADEILTMIGK